MCAILSQIAAVNANFDNVVLAFSYVPASAADGGEEYARLELAVNFDQTKTIEATWNPPDGSLGDFGNVAITSPTLSLTAEAAFQTGFGVILGPDDEEALSVLGTACNLEDEAVFACALDASEFRVTYTVGTDDPVVATATVSESGAGTNAAYHLQTALRTIESDTFPNGFATVTEVGSNLLSIEFDASISSIELAVVKNCKNAKDENDIDTTDTFECEEGYVTVKVPNPYGLDDEVTSKRGFQIAVAQSTLGAKVTLAGSAAITANLNDVIIVSAALTANAEGTLSLTVGQDQLTAYSTWVQDIVSLNHLDPLATMDGTFQADVTALAPLDSFVQAEGSFANPWQTDFFTNPGAPNITFAVNLPSIGDIRFLTYDDVVTCMDFTKQFLVGDGTIESCSGGLLDFEINGKNAFFEKSKTPRHCF